MKFHPIAFSGLILISPPQLHAGCCEHEPASETYATARAIGDYRVSTSSAYRDETGKIRTRHVLSLTESLKGKAPATLEFSTPGGRLGDEQEISSLGLTLGEGKDYILHLEQKPDGTLQPLPFRTHANAGTATQRKALRTFIRGGARGRMPKSPVTEILQDNSGVPGSRLTPTGYFENAAGVPYRHIICDNARPISCVVDIDPSKLPAGTNTAGALAIVQDALDAWSAVSSLRFKVEAPVTLGVAANTIVSLDGKLRLQLHDNHNAIPSTAVLGIGGSTISLSPANAYYATAGSGGTLAGRTFLRFPQGHVVLNHRAPGMADPENFAEVLTHEIGHALGLTHSSGEPDEPEALLKDATMYYSTHEDGRGADIRGYDQDRILFGYPLNTPPYSMDRILRAVIPTGTNPKPTGTGVDRVNITAGDLQGTVPTVNLVSGAEFALSGNTIIYTAPGSFSETLNLTPEAISEGQYYHQALFTVSDGVNQSAFHTFNITGFHRDSFVADGLPNTWMQTYFADMTVGPLGSPRHPASDPDGDGLDNRTERYLGTSPIDPKSGPAKLSFDMASRTLSFEGVRFAPYVIDASANLSSWNPRKLITTFGTPAPLPIPVTEDSAAPQMFYRARVAP